MRRIGLGKDSLLKHQEMGLDMGGLGLFSLFFAVTQQQIITIAVIIACVVGLVILMLLFNWGALWFQGFMSGAQISLLSLVWMSLRKVNTRMIVQAKIMAKQSGFPITGPMGVTTARLEAHYLAGGSVPKVIQSLIAAQRADLNLNFDQAAAIDLAGRDVLEAVRTSVNPKVIVCPDPKRGGRSMLSAIAKNGVELQVSAKVTVRTNLGQLIGGATEDTIIARVGEGIITAIGSSATHFEVMENPVNISRAVLKRGLDSQTAFQIVSIDIAKIEVGQNVGARLQIDQAEADTRVAQARAEERRALAHAVEQEMKARVTENRALVVKAEAQVPLALAAAFRKSELTKPA